MEREGCYKVLHRQEQDLVRELEVSSGTKGLRVRTMHLPDMHSLTFFRFRTIQKS